MKYLGVVRQENGTLMVPDAFQEVAERHTYEAIEVGGDIILLPTPLDRKRLRRIEELADRSIEDHRTSLEGLAR